MKKLSIFAALMVLAGCSDVVSLEQDRLDLRAEAEAEVGGVMDAWLAAHAADNEQALANLYEVGGIHATNDIYDGRTAIRQMFAQTLPVSDNFTLRLRRQVLQGALAYEYGIASQDLQGPNGPERLEGDYVVLLAQQPNGSWQIRQLIGGNAAFVPIP